MTPIQHLIERLRDPEAYTDACDDAAAELERLQAENVRLKSQRDEFELALKAIRLDAMEVNAGHESSITRFIDALTLNKKKAMLDFGTELVAPTIEVLKLCADENVPEEKACRLAKAELARLTALCKP